MNKENLVKIRDFLYEMDDSNPDSFNMNSWSECDLPQALAARDDPWNCGTTSCIAGWTVIWLGTGQEIRKCFGEGSDGCLTVNEQAIIDLAQQILDLDDGEMMDLFCPTEGGSEDATPRHAALVMDGMIANGVVDWQPALERA